MSSLYDRDLYAAAIFDVQDRFLADRKISGFRPRPLGAVRFLVTARRVNGQEQRLSTPLEMLMTTNPGGYRLFFGKVLVGKEPYRLSPGTYRASIQSEYYKPRAAIDFAVFTSPPGHGINLPEPAVVAKTSILIDLEPALNYPFPARTTRLYGAYMRRVGQDGKSPVPNVDVLAFDADGNTLSGMWTTGSRGDWLLIFHESRLAGLPEVEDEVLLPDGNVLTRMVVPVRVQFTRPDGGGVHSQQVNIVRYTENTFPATVFNGE